MTTADPSLLANGLLSRELLTAALRYERMTAAALHAIDFLGSTEQYSPDAGAVKPAMERFEKYLTPHQLTFQTFFAGMLLTSVITEVEGYFVEVMKQLLRSYPKKMGSTQFRLSDVLDKKPDELVLLAAEERLSKLMYKRPNEYIAELAEILSIDSKPLDSHWPVFVEAKARRDLGVHNSWQINDTYRRKVAEVEIQLPEKAGPDMQPDFHYVCHVVEHCDAIVRQIARQLGEKHKMGAEGQVRKTDTSSSGGRERRQSERGQRVKSEKRTRTKH
jgi:hypothetical protein